MYYNVRDFDYNVEDLINDYLIYGKDNKKTEYKIGRGWPDYKDVDIDVNIQKANEEKLVSKMNNSPDIAPKMPEPMPLYPVEEGEQSNLKIFKPSCPNCGPGPALPPPSKPRPPIRPQPMPTPTPPPRPMPPIPPGNGLCPCPQPMPQPVPRPPISPRPYGLVPNSPAENVQQPSLNTPTENTQPLQPIPYGGLMPNTPAGNVQPSQPIPEVLLPGIYQPNKAMYPTDEYSTIDDQDAKLMRLLYSEINKKIYPHVERVINEFEYVGSPIYSEQIDRETVAQMVDRVITSARSDIDEIEELLLQNNEDVRNYWSSGRMLRAIIEAMVLSDVFSIRRPRYRRIRRNYNYLNNYYNGLNYYY